MTIEQAKSNLIALAATNIGYKEGSNNWNKFASNTDLQKMYGWNPQNQPWCDIFVDVCFIECFGLEKACAMTFQPVGRGSALCSASANYYKNNNAWFTSPESGDQAFFYSGGKINHTGIVESVSGNTITVIEGNTSDMVARRTYTIGNSYIAGYGRPKYALVADTGGTATIATATIPAAASSMKYSAATPPLACMMTQSTCYRGTGTMAIKGVLWHSTGANNPWLKRYVQPDDNASNRAALLAKLGTNTNKNDWNHISVEAGLNAWIGKLADGTVATVQTMPYNYRPWGCGSGSRGSCNNGWVQFEICEDALSDASYFNTVYKEACEFTAFICKEYNINPLGTVSYGGVNVPTILCHQDSYRFGLGTNHSDVYHWFSRFGKTMDDVRNDVAKLLWGGSISSGAAMANTGHAILRKGAYNDDVKELQEKLTFLGYNLGNIDSDFGKNTLAAVMEFQLRSGLEVDGVVGAQTWAALDKAVSVKKSSTSTPAPSTNAGAVKAGDTVSIVSGATYYNGKAIPNWVLSQKWVVASVNGNRAVINVSSDGKFRINSPVNIKYLTVLSSPVNTATQPSEIVVGDIVNFTGSKHYISASAKKGLTCKAGKAKVTKIYGRGSVSHPYHLVAIGGGGSTVHGWVDADSVRKV